MDPADVVLRFLESVGRRSEAEYYVALFRATPKEQFAAISVDANVARHASEAVVLDLRFLAALGLTPVVVLGLFEPRDAAEHAARIQRKLHRRSVAARVLATGSSEALAEEAARTARAGEIPIVPFTEADGATPEERFARFGDLLARLRTRKAIFLHRPGGLRQRGVLVPIVNLTTDFGALASSKELSRKERAIVVQARRLVFDLVPHPLLVAVTSPLNLFRELFTVKGAGTLLRRGAVIRRLRGLQGVDRDRLRALLASSFGRAPREGFFDLPIARGYLEEGYRGVALVRDTPLGGYLTKFAVTREAQGEGMGRDLWSHLTADYPVLFWRARPQNPISEWYTKLADGLVRLPEWHVYWIGLPPEKIPLAVEYALSQPVDIPAAEAGN